MDVKKMDPMEVLLRPDLPNVRKELPREKVRVLRLSELTGSDVVFTIRGLTYAEVQRINEAVPEDRAAQAVLMCCENPSWKDNRLLDPDMDIATPLDAIRSRLLPGEIDELFLHIQKLSGYLKTTLGEVGNG